MMSRALLNFYLGADRRGNLRKFVWAAPRVNSAQNVQCGWHLQHIGNER